jgi:hypothetical protein
MLKHVAQLYGIIFSMLLHFSLILQWPKIAKGKAAQTQYHTRCQYELVFSKWPTIVKTSRGFLLYKIKFGLLTGSFKHLCINLQFSQVPCFQNQNIPLYLIYFANNGLD